jgi:hypothetical protein
LMRFTSEEAMARLNAHEVCSSVCGVAACAV